LTHYQSTDQATRTSPLTFPPASTERRIGAVRHPVLIPTQRRLGQLDNAFGENWDGLVRGG